MVFAQEEWGKYWYWRRQVSPSVWLVPSRTLPSAVPGHLMNRAERNEYHQISSTKKLHRVCFSTLRFSMRSFCILIYMGSDVGRGEGEEEVEEAQHSMIGKMQDVGVV